MTKEHRREYYDAQIKFLTENPEKIPNAWLASLGIFGFCRRQDSFLRHIIFDRKCGCPVMVRDDPASWGTANESMTMELLRDYRIPRKASQITPAHLPAFLEWRLRFDELENEDAGIES